eukprot:9566051-Karenia_brevis.AAC.1
MAMMVMMMMMLMMIMMVRMICFEAGLAVRGFVKFITMKTVIACQHASVLTSSSSSLVILSLIHI